MPIPYPLIIPGPLYPAQADLKKFDGVAEFLSPFNGSAEQQAFLDQHWELDLEWPEMTWAQFAPLDGFSGALHGKLGSFLWGPPLATGPRGLGSAAGIPVCAGTDLAGSNTLTTQSWLPNRNGILLPGDFFGLLSQPAVYVTTTVTTVTGGTFVAEIGVATRTGGIVTTHIRVLGPLNVGDSDYVTGTGTSFDGGPFVILSITLDVDGSYIVTWAQAGPDESLPNTVSGSLLTGNVVITTTTTTTLVTPATPIRLYQYGGFQNSASASPLNSDGGGNAVLDVFPALHEAPVAGAVLVLANPVGTFRLAENRRAAPSKKTKTFTFALKCREAI